ncbi:MAG: SDR family oxidoreductase [Fibrobacteres bacterium]|nr:SDR family oxidoreductase [Fibrobacterota bacterium]
MQELSDWTTVFQINVFALVRLTARIVPQMVERGWGRVVHVTSGIDKTWRLAACGASKWAVDKFTDDNAAELAGTGVIVSRLDPGWLRTDLGGPNADNAPESVLPGAMVPVMLPTPLWAANFPCPGAARRGDLRFGHRVVALTRSSVRPSRRYAPQDERRLRLWLQNSPTSRGSTRSFLRSGFAASRRANGN